MGGQSLSTSPSNTPESTRRGVSREQRIGAGGIIVQKNKVLLVHHYRKNVFDFWVLPGGGVEGAEGFMKATEREVLEETNLVVRSEKIVYIEDFIDEGRYVGKFWVYCELESGNLSISNKDADETFLEDAGFFSKDKIQTMNVFPLILKGTFWEDLADGFRQIKYLGNSSL